ncbi:hypothetical protein B5G34_03095 [Flavonifractor sp. An82]|uniref:S-layer homology domain-containing protein n=1 Tax=Flavonifractor sp. An82 TaxID=1965660 RepID=UPI000B39897B|nr:hypothetical protein B5G34_03095 [Flavonifractor sp. An82]
MNEKGVSVSATVSTSNNDNVKAADPLVDTGICEISLTSVILMSAESARDGVEKLADLTENKMPTYSMDMAYTFDDVDASAWYADAVSYVAEKGIMNGAGNGTFLPSNTLTRSQLATILMRFLENVA